MVAVGGVQGTDVRVAAEVVGALASLASVAVG